MRSRWIGGALLAAVSAGPILTAPILVTPSLGGYGAPGVFAALVSVVGLAVFSVPFGFTISVGPALAASALLTLAGQQHRWLRHPLVWAAAGLILGWLIGSLLTREVALGNIVFGGVGLLCALLARWRTRWID